ncbi:Flp pilus assembly protein CpaB [Bacillus sp. HMF5848]|uniref:Flp pilus assembly protein CpaB n=1 Tax=Bacillus sp. HMF5848 TaxID=2495421 RepID=UPI000F795013|nr:Flp pilus assembly protein CpaB [Bacillus sp. HMF5848]RSK26374.1 Flp pilus assembly protein CpaB [Bacillus sp. HMF5848]
MRSKVILFLALVMGLVTTFLFYNYMKQFDSEATVAEVLTEVVVAKVDILENQRITSDMIELKSVPELGVHQNSITDLSELSDMYATGHIAAGEPILTNRVSSEQQESLFVSRKVRDGYRAVSVGVNFVQSVSNLIEPEDEVDVIFTEGIPKPDGTQEFISKTILEKARVLAIGRKMLPTVEGAEEEYVEYSSVTVELVPNDALKLVNASERGSIQFILHTRLISPETDAAASGK